MSGVKKKAGYLQKQGAVVKSWKKRWFQLHDYTLDYYTKQNGRLKGSIQLIQVTHVTEVNYPAKPFCFQVATPQRSYLISCTSQQLRQDWVELIKEMLNQQQLRKTYTSLTEVSAKIPDSPASQSVPFKEPVWKANIPSTSGVTKDWTEVVNDVMSIHFVLPIELVLPITNSTNDKIWTYNTKGDSEVMETFAISMSLTIEQQGGYELFNQDFKTYSKPNKFFTSLDKWKIEDTTNQTITTNNENAIFAKESPFDDLELKVKRHDDLHSWQLWIYTLDKKIVLRFQVPFEAYTKGNVQSMMLGTFKSASIISNTLVK